MSETYRIKNMNITRDELLNLEHVILRALIHERTHHTIEVSIYQILSGHRKIPVNFGSEVDILLEIWEERRLPMDEPDIQWAKRYLENAKRISAGEELSLDTDLPKPFSENEIKTVEKLLFRRRSIRHRKDKEVPDWMIQRILEAGLAAPNACNARARAVSEANDKIKEIRKEHQNKGSKGRGKGQGN